MLAAYLAACRRRALVAYLAGPAPGIGLLLAYDTLAFGSPPYVILNCGY